MADIWNPIVDSWWYSIPTPWAQIGMVLVAVGCGGIVGTEREKREKPAGLRTLVLVSLGSTLFTMASYTFTTTTGDSGRVAAQIVAGVGFLGAGAILHGSNVVTGMTTAATIWVIAAIGMVVGTGHAVAGLGLSVLVRALLTSGHALEGRKFGGTRASVVRLMVQPNHGKARVRLEKILGDFHVHHWKLEAGQGPDGTLHATIHLKLPQRQRTEFLSELANLAEVMEIQEEPLERDR